MNSEVKKPAYMAADWFQGLRREVAASKVAVVAERMGISRPTLSILLNGLGAYGSGKASTVRIERRYRQAFESIVCPFDGARVDTAHCREKANGKAPNHNPMKMHHWQACQGCEYKPRPIPPQPIVVKRRAKKADAAELPMAAIDNKTLPLPEVGAPQIDLTSKEST